MSAKKLSNKEVKTYLEMLMEFGEHGFYLKIVNMGLLRRASNIKNPELELLDISDAFFSMYRKTEEDILFTIGKIFRRAAHALHRQLKKEQNKKFLHRIK